MLNEKYSEALKAYEEFWERKDRKRCVLNMTAPTGPRYRAPKDLNEKWLDENYLLDKAEYDMENTYYVAEGIPFLFTNLGPGCLAACLGGGYELAERTIWFDRVPFVTDWENPPEISLNTDSEMWGHIERLQNKFLTSDKLNVSITDIGGVMDIVASLRGTQELLYDLYDYPDEVKEFTNKITKIWLDFYKQQLEVVGKNGQPYNNWMNIPSSKPWYPLQSDFCAMISPAQFEEFILPHIAEQSASMPRSIYHLDGPGEIPHIDMLLDIPTLTGIEWVAGDGHEPVWDEKWFPLIKKIQDKKKNVVLRRAISMNDLAGAEKLIKTFDPVGLYLSVTAPDKDSADRILELVEKWSQ